MTVQCGLGHEMAEGQARCGSCGLGPLPPSPASPQIHPVQAPTAVEQQATLPNHGGALPPGWYEREGAPSHWDGTTWSTPIRPAAPGDSQAPIPPAPPGAPTPPPLPPRDASARTTNMTTVVLVGIAILVAVVFFGTRGSHAPTDPYGTGGAGGTSCTDPYAVVNQQLRDNGNSVQYGNGGC